MLQCPKCHATMRTYNRNGVHIEQCDGCRGIFLDYGELEALSRLESQWAPPPQPPMHGVPVAPQAPAWGAPHHHYGHKKHKSFAKMLFSS
ncbi:zf-TFIIB domain-containing protein [Sorangium sp. So ce429]